jgi:hypothetical protein
MQNLKSLPDITTKHLNRAGRIPAVCLSAMPAPTISEWRESDQALQAFVELVNQHPCERRGFGPFWALTARA